MNLWFNNGKRNGSSQADFSWSSAFAPGRMCVCVCKVCARVCAHACMQLRGTICIEEGKSRWLGERMT